MSAREYIKSSIAELEKLVEANLSNKPVLKRIEFELQHRKTTRAKGLSLVVREQIKSFHTKNSDNHSNIKNKFGSTENSTQPQNASLDHERPKREFQFDESRDIIKNLVNALELEVEAIRKKSYSSTIEIRNGKKVKEGDEGYLYIFPNSDDIKLNDDSPIVILINGDDSNGTVVSTAKKQIAVSLDEDHGPTIHYAQIKIDNSFLVARLKEKLSEISQAKSESVFNLHMAKKAMGEEASQKPGNALPTVDLGTMNDSQKESVHKAGLHEVFFLWGPPGTGKTFTLAKITEAFYARRDRILLVSNTNLAVDTLLEKVCEALHGQDKDFDKGAVIRFGNVLKPELIEKFGSYVNVDLIVERLGQSLKSNRRYIEATLLDLKSRLEPLCDAIDLFDLMDEIPSKMNECKKNQAQFRKRKKKLQTEQLNHKESCAHFEAKLAEANSAGKFKRLLKGLNPEKINAKLLNQKINIENTEESLDNVERRIASNEKAFSELESKLAQSKKDTSGHTRESVEKRIELYRAKSLHLSDQLKKIDQQLSQLRENVLKNCRIVASTATQTYLKSKSFDAFDTVVIDEASMLQLPLVAYVAGLSKKNVIIAGDFRQLPPIVSSDHPAVSKYVGQDVFSKSGVAKAVQHGKRPDNLVQLTTQYRMKEQICDLINETFYGGNLITHSNTGMASTTERHPGILSDVLTLVDTSPLYPFANFKRGTYSRYNVLHAIAVRNLAYHLNEMEYIQGTEDLGIITPYAAQAKFISKLCAEIGLDQVQCGTVHRFQGNEKNTIIIDIPDSFGVSYLSKFVTSTSIDEDGAKLINVAISRAKSQMVLFANVPFLESKLPKGALLRHVIQDMQNHGAVKSVEEIIDLGPNDFIKPQLPYAHLPETKGSTTVFNETNFDDAFKADMAAAQSGIVIFSGFCTTRRVGYWGDIFREKTKQGVALRAVTRPPGTQGNINNNDSEEAIGMMRNLGVVVDLRSSVHEKICFIDDRILWHGSLNPLSHTGKTDESMLRINSKEACLMMAEHQCLRYNRNSKGSSPFDLLTIQENPPCDNCSAPTVLHTQARFGPYFSCSAKCGWKASLDRTGKVRTGNREKSPEPESGIICAECGMLMVLRNGRYGKFWGMHRFSQLSAYGKVQRLGRLAETWKIKTTALY